MNGIDVINLCINHRASKKAQVAFDAHWRACRNRYPSIIIFRGRANASIEYDWYTMARQCIENERLDLFIDRLSVEVSALIDAHGPALRRAKTVATIGTVWGEFARIPQSLVEPFVSAITGSVAAALKEFPP